jgi:hypothetical protein
MDFDRQHLRRDKVRKLLVSNIAQEQRLAPVADENDCVMRNLQIVLHRCPTCVCVDPPDLNADTG